MFFVNLLLLVSSIAMQTTSDLLHDGNDKVRINLLNYAGEKFPIRYLVPDDAVPTILDLTNYIKYLQRSLNYFGNFLNSTNCNVALSVFFSKSILKRTLLDYRSKLQSSEVKRLLKAINDADNILSHYIYSNAFYDWSDSEFRLSQLFKNDEILIHNIEKFNRNQLEKLVLGNEYMNEFIEEIDEGTLPKEKYVQLVESMSDYFIGMEDSDLCISRVAFNREPLDYLTTQPCLADDYCNRRITSQPSVAYSLSHRMLNMYLRLKVKKCYIKSEEDDLKEIHKLCAFMYRETVYIARRGYFSRDLFLEHITLCAMMGYEEFHRQHWFKKAVSWMNNDDCIKEFRNFEINRTKLVKENLSENPVDKHSFTKWICDTLYSFCDMHPSALLMVVISHAIRYTAHFMQLL